MKPMLGNTLLSSAIVAGALLMSAVPPARAITDSSMMKSDHLWVKAASKSDAAAVAGYLDTDFSWTTASGATFDAARVSKTVPKTLLGDEKDAKHMEYTYGRVVVLEVNSGTAHVLRVWVLRPIGWRLLVYQEVKALGAPPTVTPGTGKTCENPCKTVPYQPKNADEKDVIASYKGLETSAVAHDAKGWDAHTATEFAAASSNSDKLLDKPTRLAELSNANMSGVAPTPLISAHLVDFPTAVIMRSVHKPDQGKNLQITRVWVKRNGTWLETLSYQTSIQPQP